MLLEAHYTIYFTPNDTENGLSYKIDNVTIDMIYGDYTPTSCSANVQLTQKTSVKFMQSIYSRKNSGGPGYIKGSPLLVGNITATNDTADALDYINQTFPGFVLRGADNNGNCYNLQTSLTTGLNATNYLLSSTDQLFYFDDPLLVFEDSLLYGCTLQLNRT